MLNKKEIGDQAETIAQKFLREQHLTLLTTNFHTRFGEIDIIALDNNDLIFIEVRFRKNNAFGGAAASINQTKQKRLLTSAEIYLQQNRQHLHRNMRFDVIAIKEKASDPGYQLEWIQDAFQTTA